MSLGDAIPPIGAIPPIAIDDDAGQGYVEPPEHLNGVRQLRARDAPLRGDQQDSTLLANGRGGRCRR
jgi:hypothetical protein